MAKVKKTKKKDPEESKLRFVLTLPLCCEPYQTSRLDAIFQASCNIRNALIADTKKKIEQLEKTKAWQQNQAMIRQFHQDKTLSDAERKHLCAPYYQIKQEMLRQYQLTEFALEFRVKKYAKHYKKCVGSQIAQRVSTQVARSVDQYFYGNGQDIHFCKNTMFRTIESKQNGANITFDGQYLHIGGSTIPVKIDPKDGYQKEALEDPLCYCRVERRPYPEGWRYFVQLVLKGTPPVKVDPETGGLKHPVASGKVGLDIGPQTLAYCGNDTVGLTVLAPELRKIEKELRIVNRAMDRSRRATGPDFFDTDGKVIPIDKLRPELLTSRKKRKWNISKHYHELELKRLALYDRQRRQRIQAHNELANRLLASGTEFLIEDMNFHALAKRTKKQESPGPGKRQKCRKRFGKSIARRAPAAFVQILGEKAARYGGFLTKINTWEAKASQYDHQSDEYHKKSLSQRWDKMPDGHQIQRDIYSAFLIRHINSDLSTFDKEGLKGSYPKFVQLHDAAITALKPQRSCLPKSVGF